MVRGTFCKVILCGVLIILSSMMTGCTSTNLISQVNNDFSNHHFQRLMAHGNFLDLGYRKLAEEQLCKEIHNKTNCDCIKSLDIFFHAEEYDSTEIEKRLQENMIEGVLTLQPTGAGTTSIYIPSATYTTANVHIHGNSATGSSTTTEFGGFDLSQPWADYEAILRSTVENKVAWYATAGSRGSAFSEQKDLLLSAISGVVDDLIKEEMLVMNSSRQTLRAPKSYYQEIMHEIKESEITADHSQISISTEADQKFSSHTDDQRPAYIDVFSSIEDKLIMVIQPRDRPMVVGEVYQLVCSNNIFRHQYYSNAGTAKVILIRGEKVVLKYKLNNPNILEIEKLKIKRK